MSHNLEYLLSRPGVLKLATIIFGIVASTLSTHSYEESPYTQFHEKNLTYRDDSHLLPGTELELSNMTITNAILGVSFFYLVAHCVFYELEESRLNKFIDTGFHMAGSLFLFAGGTTLLYAAVNIEKNGCPEFHLRPSDPNAASHSGLTTLLTVFTKSAWDYKRLMPDPYEELCHYFGEKVVAGCFNLLNAVVYAFLGFVIFSTDVESS